ncbi:hypothetical protein AMATHDRAFT_76970 [Amanita thiersii Skay4041]|uniref:Glycosyltransferase 61 catalytic domain-containing protein n=1 Tax=Amanita thiersii Skay4041 TaxID=703135 RepID=A0A2A9NI18_9AGAR|nr:hypothetical protein AMATHDRAFT_76970 [Amanita thiersii Skay4041]
MLDRLYMKNGTLFIVTNDPSEFPSRPHIISRPVDIGAGLDMTPTDQELQFITPEESQLILGEHAVRVDGLSFIVSDNNQFVNHYYHLWGEIILGAWRIYSSLRSSTRSRHLPFPDRIILPHIAARSWRDPARVNGALLRAAFPSSSLLASDYWGDLIELGQPIVFERALIINREAAHGDPLYQNLYKMIAGTWGVEAPADFWEPIRQSAVENAVGYLPLLDSRGIVVSPDSKKTTLPVVVYVSRQRASSRRLTQNDHYLLVQSLAKLAEEGVCEFQAVEMEGMSLKEQIELVARATIIVGVHGNGLTHQLWMPRSSRSTVVEIFAPGSYTFDYEFLARNMGHRHYAVWNDTLLTYPAGSRHEVCHVCPSIM